MDKDDRDEASTPSTHIDPKDSSPVDSDAWIRVVKDNGPAFRDLLRAPLEASINQALTAAMGYPDDAVLGLLEAAAARVRAAPESPELADVCAAATRYEGTTDPDGPTIGAAKANVLLEASLEYLHNILRATGNTRTGTLVRGLAALAVIAREESDADVGDIEQWARRINERTARTLPLPGREKKALAEGLLVIAKAALKSSEPAKERLGPKDRLALLVQSAAEIAPDLSNDPAALNALLDRCPHRPFVTKDWLSVLMHVAAEARPDLASDSGGVEAAEERLLDDWENGTQCRKSPEALVRAAMRALCMPGSEVKSLFDFERKQEEKIDKA